MKNYNYRDTINIAAIPQDTLVRFILFCCGIIVTAISLLNLFHTNAGVDYTNDVIYQENQVLTRQDVNNLEMNNTEAEAESETIQPSSSIPITPTTSQIKNATPTNVTTSVQKGTTLTNLLSKQGISPQEIRQIQSLPQVRNYLFSIRAGQKFEISSTSDHHLNTLKYYIAPQKFLVIKNNKQHFYSEFIDGELTAKVHSSSITVLSSIAAAMKKAGLHSKLVNDLNQILSTREIQQGTRLSILYEGIYKTGKLDHVAHIYAVKLSNDSKNAYVFRNIDPNGEISYYDLEGQSLKQAFLRAPLHYRTISSPFNLHRMHPILRYVRPHTGVDLSAPSGTPVVASSDGKVTFVGSEGGYGRVIKIQNSQQYSTIFAHLSGFAKNLKRGMRIQKGQVIGYVGRTGLADGPHLHYELHVNGKPVNPMTVQLPQAHSIPKSQKAQYLMYANQILHDYLTA
jgi:murein DD-endopeptidase MepM/ murein hydrolase activator NlpD